MNLFQVNLQERILCSSSEDIISSQSDSSLSNESSISSNGDKKNQKIELQTLVLKQKLLHYAEIGASL